jgi:hypothetical protein
MATHNNNIIIMAIQTTTANTTLTCMTRCARRIFRTHVLLRSSSSSSLSSMTHPPPPPRPGFHSLLSRLLLPTLLLPTLAVGSFFNPNYIYFPKMWKILDFFLKRKRICDRGKAIQRNHWEYSFWKKKKISKNLINYSTYMCWRS